MAVKLQSVSCEKMQSVGPKSGRKNKDTGSNWFYWNWKSSLVLTSVRKMNWQTLVVSWKSFLNICNDWSAEKYEILCSQHFLYKILTSPHYMHVICELVLRWCTCPSDKLLRKEPEKEKNSSFYKRRIPYVRRWSQKTYFRKLCL